MSGRFRLNHFFCPQKTEDSNLEKKFDENSWRAGGVVLVQSDGHQHGPVDRVGEEKVGEDLGHVPELANFESEKCIIKFRVKHNIKQQTINLDS